MVRHFLNPPNWFTSASIFCTTYAMMLMISNPGADPDVLVRACVLVVFGGIFDLMDGRVARLTNRYSEFGIQLDSIADVIGFGVAPAMLAYAWKLSELGPVGVAITFWYVLATAFRLARFNVATTDTSWPFAGHSQGLTSTMSGGILVSMIWLSNGYFVERGDLPPLVVGAFVATLGLLMVSSIPYRTFKDMRHNLAARRMLAVALGACLVSAVVIDPSMWWGTGAVLYLAWGTVDGIAVLARHRANADELTASR